LEDETDYHHTAADTFDKVRVDEMRGVVGVLIAPVYTLVQQS